ncbi:hypothetical protein BO221_48015 [Archangium sp. Cb G35]|uniref:hypothetical protein n=1 Tax=Archangium sp. Cb G35 TaxID=1920190 RepID=UPI00093608BB|nr:hypothetical protein [Archangium sp. Cb G35]OJT16855.1 hypothetical protein BO221_48015 [Archangium sp. Cb G35]
MMDLIDKLGGYVGLTIGVLFTVALFLSFVVESVEIVREPVREFFRKLTIKRVIRAVPGLLVLGVLAWVVLRPWIAPEGTPLERCLKGQVPREFLEGDRDKLRTFDLAFDLAAARMEARHKQQWEQSTERLVLEGRKTTPEQRDALMSAQLQEVKRLWEYGEQKHETLCREAASRIASAAPVAVSAEP